ncbi:MAG TPA: DUF2231 domain-containing protein [Ramlibacter sp.]|nr:DUF2231 domain-containing protein [Ramlibacter sp.]
MAGVERWADYKYESLAFAITITGAGLGFEVIPLTVAMSALAIAMLAVSGWLGGKMVYLAGVGVSTEAPLPQDDKRHA